MKALVRVCDVMEETARLIGIVLFAIMIVVVFYEVVARYLFNAPTFWSAALARLAMVWLVMLGLARGLRVKDNIRVDFLVEQMPRKLQIAAAWLRLAAVAIFALVMVVFGLQLSIGSMNHMIGGLQIAKAWLYLSVPVAGALILLFTVENIAKGDLEVF